MRHVLMHGVPAAALGLAGLALLLPAGCDTDLEALDTQDTTIYSRPPKPIDFARATELAAILFDLSDTATISDQQLQERYDGANIDVYVVSTTFPGDDSPSRYMFFVDHDRRTQTLALSGTNSQTLWDFNLDLEEVFDTDLNSYVHRGFNNIALTVLDDVLPRLELDYPISVIGYSLGGAMAVLLADYLFIDGYEVVEVVTFGQPKVGNDTTRESFAFLPITRFINAFDPVPHLPPGNFLHFAAVVVLLDGPYYAYLSPGDPDYESATTGNLILTLLANNFKEHGKLYVDRLQAKTEQAIQVPYGQKYHYVNFGDK